MLKGFYNNASNLNYKNIIAIDALRDIAKERIQEAQAKLDPRHAFNRAKEATSHDSLIGSLILGAFMWGLVGNVLDGLAGGDCGLDLSHQGAIASTVEAYEVISSDEMGKKRRRAVAGYPEGRVQDPLMQSKVNERFNMVAANENVREDYDANVEIAVLAQMLDTLEMMKRRGITAMGVDKKETVSQTLTKIRRAMLENQVFSSFQIPVRRAMA